MVIPGHPGGLGKIFLDQNVSWPCGISMQKKFADKSSSFKKFEKRGGEKMIIPGHPGGLAKIFFRPKCFLVLRN